MDNEELSVRAELDWLSTRLTTGHRRSKWAHENFGRLVRELVMSRRGMAVLEIGAGRKPLIEADLIEQVGATFYGNDVDEAELKLGPDFVRPVLFDVGDVTVPPLQVDVLYSRMVMEHVKNPDIAYENFAKLLMPGGIMLHFFPVLYSPPFVINKLMPEWLSSFILRIFVPWRNPSDRPKFPAYYRWCTADGKLEKKLKSLGFEDVLVAPFYGHGYFRRIPILGALDTALAEWARRRNLRLLASFVILIARRSAKAPAKVLRPAQLGS